MSNLKLMKYLLIIWSLTGILLLSVTSLLYLNWNGFIEQGEVTFSTVSYLLSQGYPLYVDIDAAERYSIQHGPMIYMIIGCFMKLLGPGYLTAKLANVAALLLTIIISWLLYSSVLDKKNALCLLGLECWCLLHWTYSYLCRPDSMMLFCVTVSLYVAAKSTDKTRLILGTAIPLGIMINLKIHGFLYFLPILAIIYQQFSRRDFLIAGSLAMILGAAPFLLPQISLKNYLMWLSLSISHGILVEKIVAKFLLLSALFAVPVLVGIICGVDMRGFYRRYKHIFISFFIALILPVIIGSKSGSGTNHLIPFIPTFFYILLLAVSFIKQKSGNLPEITRNSGATRTSSFILALILIVTTISGINGEKRVLSPMLDKGSRKEIFQEVRLLQEKYKERTFAIGYGDEESFWKYRDFVPLPVFAGNPYLIDKVAFVDMSLSGLKIPPATIKKLADGEIQVWLIPTGKEPFDLGFDKAFRQAFFNNYMLISRETFFDVWVHKNISPRLKEI